MDSDLNTQILSINDVSEAHPNEWQSLLLQECLSKSFTDLFEWVTVVRDPDDQRVHLEDVPNAVVKLVTSPGIEGSLDAINCHKQLLVREEYLWAVKDAKSACYNHATEFDTPAHLIHPSVQQRILPLAVQSHPPTFDHNPFDDVQGAQPFFGKGRAFAYLGHPGVGKTALSTVILVLRCLANLTTIIQTTHDVLYLFYPQLRKVYRVKMGFAPTLLKKCLPRDTWCLIDSNEEVQTVAQVITSMFLFVVQTTSPRAHRTKWISKRGYVTVPWHMANWTLNELICGRDFNPLEPHIIPSSEKDLEAFISVFPPSARIADTFQDGHYDFGKHVQAFSLGSKIASMTMGTLSRLLADDPKYDEDDAISHHIIAVTPGPARHLLATYIPSREVYHLMRDKLVQAKAWEAATLYSLFLRNPFARGSAGYMLEDVLHILLGQGGTWNVTALHKGDKGSVNTIWETGVKTTVLAIGYDGSTSCAIFKLGELSPIKCVNVLTRFFNPTTTETLRTGFYRPQSGSQPTFDAFYYDAETRTAKIFQSTVSNDHNVSRIGIRWLVSCGMLHCVYFAVTPTEVDIRLPFPNDLTDLIDEDNVTRYQLGLSEDEVVVASHK